MYCRNCGTQLNPNASVCVNCGVAVGNGTNFCPNCGEPTIPDAVICVKCGVALKQQPQGEPKSKITAGLLGIFLGGGNS